MHPDMRRLSVCDHSCLRTIASVGWKIYIGRVYIGLNVLGPRVGSLGEELSLNRPEEGLPPYAPFSSAGNG